MFFFNFLEEPLVTTFRPLCLPKVVNGQTEVQKSNVWHMEGDDVTDCEN